MLWPRLSDNAILYLVLQFKSELKKVLYSNTNNFQNNFTETASIHHARMRMGPSDLNAQRKKYPFIMFNNCVLCGSRPKHIIHYYLKCPKCAKPRTV